MGDNIEKNTFYDDRYTLGNHQDYIALGLAAKELYNESIIKNLYLHIEPYLYSSFSNSNINEKGNIVIEYPDNEYQKESIIKGLNEYCLWDPHNEKLAIGYHSVTSYFNNAIKSPVNYVLGYNHFK